MLIWKDSEMQTKIIVLILKETWFGFFKYPMCLCENQALGNILNTPLGNTYFTFRKIRIVKWVDIFVGWTIPGSVLRDKESFLRQLTNCSHQVSITLRLISKKVNSIPFISKFLSGQSILITTEHTKYKLLGLPIADPWVYKGCGAILPCDIGFLRIDFVRMFF